MYTDWSEARLKKREEEEEELKKTKEKRQFEKMKKCTDWSEARLKKREEEEEELKNKKEKQQFEKRRSDAMKIWKSADWTEFTEGYTRSYFDINDDGMREGAEKEEFVDMSQPRPCSFNKTDVFDKVEEIVEIKAPAPYTNSTSPPVQFNGITVRQLRAVWANIARRCIPEGWTDYNGDLLKPEDVSLYDVDKYIILPFTADKEISFVEMLPSTAGPQPPMFFISHWWGEPVRDFILCLERAILDFSRNCGDEHERRGGGMSADTPVWVCAYANNQWALGEDIPEDPNQSGFTKAMEVAQGRTITILDKDGIVFSRIWCTFELFLTFNGTKTKDGLWAVYTAHTHTYKDPEDYDGIVLEEERKALGIISGGSTSDGAGSARITAREACFPFELIKKSLSIQVESAESSVESDRVHILNSIVGNPSNQLNNTPHTTHNKYAELNDNLRGNFASSTASLQGAAKEGGEGWKRMIEAFSKGSVRGKMDFDFEADGPWGGLTAVQATELVAHLPLTIDTLWIENAEYGIEFMRALIERVKKFHNMKGLYIQSTLVGGEEEGQEAGLRLAGILSCNTTIDYIVLPAGLIGAKNVEEWGNALMENKTLTRFEYDGELGDEIVDELQTKTEDREPKLEIDVW